MTRRALVGGWCPKHDRVYESAGDRCPECGTALVPLGAGTAPPERPHEEILASEEPAPDDGGAPPAPSRAAWLTRGLVALAVGGAFLLGVLLPEPAPEEGPPPTGDPVVRTVAVRGLVQAPGGVLRLERVLQNGRRLQLEFSAFQGISEPRLIVGAGIEITTDGAGGSSTYGLGDTRLLAGPEGFTVTGELEAPDEPVVRVRLTSLQVRVEDEPEWGVDVSPVWPVRGAEPSLLRVPGGTRTVGDGQIRLTAILGWSDRLDAVFEQLGPSEGEGRYELGEIELLVGRADAGGTRIGQTPQVVGGAIEQVSDSRLVVHFDSVPRDARRVTIHALRFLRFLAGPWAWEVRAAS